MNKTLKNFAFVISCLFIQGCSHGVDSNKEFNIVGAWTLDKMIFQDGSEVNPNPSGYTRCKVYDADSTYYCVELVSREGDVRILSHEAAKFTQHDTVYIENGRKTPFKIKSNSVFMTTFDGYTEVWVRADKLTEEKKQEIRDSFMNSNGTTLSNYISNEQQEKEKSKFLIILGSLVAIIIGGCIYLVITLRGKRKAQKELQAIMDENASHTTEISEKLQQAENDLFGSDYYTSLKKRVMKGDTLKKADWDEMSAQLKEAFPKFESRLSSLCKMSDVEMQVCMLLKLRFSPSEIATVIVKDASTISSIRGRLYQKVFGKKGGAKDWDEFLKGL